MQPFQSDLGHRPRRAPTDIGIRSAARRSAVSRGGPDIGRRALLAKPRFVLGIHAYLQRRPFAIAKDEHGTGERILLERFLAESRQASKAGAELLFDVIATAYERNSLIVTTNLPFENWTEVLGSERLTGAALDRLTHRCHILETKGESYRLQDAKRHRRRTD